MVINLCVVLFKLNDIERWYHSKSLHGEKHVLFVAKQFIVKSRTVKRQDLRGQSFGTLQNAENSIIYVLPELNVN